MDTRQRISELIGQGHVVEAAQSIRAWLDEESSTARYSFVSNLLQQSPSPSLRRFRIGLLSSFTHNALKPFLEVEAFLSGSSADTYFSGYDQWRQELMISGSGVDRFAPDVIVLMVHLEDLSPRLFARYFSLSQNEIEEEITRSVQDILQCVKSYRGRASTPIIVQNFMVPPLSISRAFDWSTDMGVRSNVFEMNRRLASGLREIPGVAILDYDDVTSRFGKGRWRDSRLFHTAKSPIDLRAMPHLAAEIIHLVKALLIPRLKCIVTDLDNTLWGGIVGEDGISGIQLGPQYPGSAYVSFQEFLLQMRSLGVLLAVNSRNNLNDALEVFEGHPHCVLKLDHFTAYRINWHDKSINLRELAEELNIGLDAMMFVDDNAVECERVRQEIPSVTVVQMKGNPIDFPELILKAGVFFSHNLTEEDRKRGDLYLLQRRVNEAMAGSTSFEDFAKGLGMELTIEPVTLPDIPRVAQLTQKTNQFNLTTKRYQESEISQMLSAADKHLFLLRLKDRFGDYGIIGVIILDAGSGAWSVDTFLMSCRVIGRKVEDAAIIFMENLAAQHKAKHLVGEYRPTAKNGLVKDLYEKAGFRLLEQSAGVIKWTVDLSRGRQYPDIIKVIVTQ